MVKVAETLKAKPCSENVFISSGAGAGLAAAFNVPIAGLMFVLEEVHHTFSPLVAVDDPNSSDYFPNFISLNVFGVHPSLNLGNDQRFPMEYYGYVVLSWNRPCDFRVSVSSFNISLAKDLQDAFPKSGTV